MINIWVILFILFWHWVADFLCQSDWMATNKSKNNLALTLHVLVYTILWLFPVVCYGTYINSNINILLFLPITLICHFTTDYITSRINSKLYKENKIHDFFVSVGFDQFLHFAQLLLTYYILTK